MADKQKGTGAKGKQQNVKGQSVGKDLKRAEANSRQVKDTNRSNNRISRATGPQ